MQIYKIFQNEKIDLLLNKYVNIFNCIIINDTNNELMNRVLSDINNILKNINNYLNDFNNNINLLKDEYFNFYYIKNSSQFLEYPGEIVYKINQFLKELNEICQKIKNTIDLNIQNKIKTIIKSTNIYIYNFLKNHFDYILLNLNSKNIINEYYLPIYQKLNETFNNCLNNLKNTSDNFDSDILLLSFQEYELQMNNIINNSKEFILYLEDIIELNFTSEFCEESLSINNNSNTLNNK